MKAYALLGGPKEEWPSDLSNVFRRANEAGDLIIGVDRGSFLLEQLGISPQLAIGDFDSLKKRELSQVETKTPDIRYSNPIKDLTDTELMIRAVFEDYQVSDLILFGATGGRIDHFLSNLFMFLKPAVRQFAPRVTLIDQQNEIKFFLPGKHQISSKQEFKYFGVMNLNSVKNLNILGAKYELRDFNSSDPQIFASNEFKTNSHEFTLKFDSGIVSVIFSKDLERFYRI